MPDKFLTAIITDLAKLRIRIDSIPNRPLRDELEKEFEMKRLDLIKVIPNNLEHKINELFEAELENQLKKGTKLP